VAWNTLFLALLTATGTTVLGTMMALMAERSASARVQTPLNVVALLPIITPPFVVGLGLILLFGRAGVVNQFLEWAFGIPPTRWFYGLLGIWIAQMFAFTPIAFMIMRGVVQGVAPAWKRRRRRCAPTAAAPSSPSRCPAQAGPGQCLPGGLHREHGGLRQPDRGGRAVFGAVHRHLLRHRRRAVRPGARGVAGLDPHAVRAGRLCPAARCSASRTTPPSAARATPASPWRCPTVCAAVHGVVYPWLAFTVVVYLFAFAGGFVQTWGRDYTPTLATTSDRLRAAVGRVRPGLGRHGLELAVHHGQAGGDRGAHLRRARPADRLAAGAHRASRAQRGFEFGALLAFAIPGTVLGVSYILAFNVPPFELTGTGADHRAVLRVPQPAGGRARRHGQPSSSSTSRWTRPR
jgi:iron(III) transport system permease protein